MKAFMKIVGVNCFIPVHILDVELDASNRPIKVKVALYAVYNEVADEIMAFEPWVDLENIFTNQAEFGELAPIKTDPEFGSFINLNTY